MKSRLMFVVLLAFASAGLAKNNSRILESVSAKEREATLTAIIDRSGRECGEITQSFLQGYDKADAAYWSVSCSNGASYSIQVQSDANAVSRVVACGIMKVMGVECFKKFSGQ